MGLLDNGMKPLLRGATRGPLTPKHGNKNYFKGTGVGRLGSFTRKGLFKFEQWKRRQWIVPDLTDFHLTPFVTPKVNISSEPLRVLDYFQGPLPDDLHQHPDFVRRCLDAADQEITLVREKLSLHSELVKKRG